ncbi:TorA maturation chaperone TorD [Natronocella acetinitrilica]|uniref:TorA maturation chaperone TorD n=1 Tax=Natronocella acetinitrilica TaxID=414046 RepID=A0AAE3G6J0_9GAMM|nr:molecular chaperone TorD family protein [Natronocella acetinitrilica]MCP1676695.1 TorA maturation chaperone TorD [Natronocella acetinitrilica]
MAATALKRTSTRPPAAPAQRAQARAACYLNLAQCLRPPHDPALVAAMGSDLVPDLREALVTLGDPPELRESVRRLEQALAEPGAGDRLLRDYTWLFLTPPYRVDLNAGLYLDGALMGPSVQQLVQLYRRHGVEKGSAFHDLPDHIALLLEFSAMLWAKAAESLQGGDRTQAESMLRDQAWLLARHYLGWMSTLATRIDAVGEGRTGATVYAGLTALVTAIAELEFADIRHLLAAEDTGPTPQAMVRQELPPVPPRQAVCGGCGEPFTLQGERAAIHARLEEAGLDASHVAICKRCGTG